MRRAYKTFPSIASRWELVRGYADSPKPTIAPGIKKIKDARIHITSHKLCDDVLERLAPTLPTDRPLDIIDVYPGVGIWSSRFHDHIRPRRHILLEPNFKTYQSFLNPLLTSPGSRYLHLPWDPVEDRTFANLYDKGYLPEQTKREKGSTEVNDTLLVLANMTLLRSATNIRTLDIRKYIESVLDQSYFHRYGLVRIIAIFPTSNVDAILPKSISRRRRTQTLLECVAADVKEVAGDTSETVHWTRRGLEVLKHSADMVAKRLKTSPVKVPAGREAIPLELAPEPAVVDESKPHFPRPIHDWHREYLKVQEDLKTEEASVKVKKPLPPKLKELRKRLRALKKRYAYENRQIQSAHVADDRQSGIDRIESKLRRVMNGTLPVPTHGAAGRMIKRLAALKEERDVILSSLGKQYLDHHYPVYVNERRVMASSSLNPSPKPLLLWDKRAYEPLHVNKHEFFPYIPCSIVDIQPNPNSLILEAQRKFKASNQPFKYISALTTYLALLRTFTTASKKSVEQLLRQVFASRPIAEFPSAIPSLAEYATPKITLDAKEAATWKDVKTSEAGVIVGYDTDCLADATLQRLPSKVVWDIAVEWERWRAEKNMPDTLSKSLGGAFVEDMNEAFGKR
ncbi:uncharacterized protein GIQ15_01748 [Arthroderma uncinatum]|uniref:uncharacterized protein n=1 Tax=Arthroderma uncinatum TaxID=74035 RepID=UPI00144A9459|nr:uncharacterized protein GIQ15_01748 [Arthroderma uncinatum]KAF3492231.1 hypothetical protein GIQ15_01748 [Arthroderma uncinatum]